MFFTELFLTRQQLESLTGGVRATWAARWHHVGGHVGGQLGTPERRLGRARRRRTGAT